MKYFLDTEFDENGTTIKLISLALVSEIGQTYYAVASDGWREEDCDPWVRQNVTPHLPEKGTWKPRAQIRDEVKDFLLGGATMKPEIWAYFADYDWVVLCQLFGRMVDLPQGIPHYCRDLKQLMDMLGVSKRSLPEQEGVAHDALADAKWVQEAYKHLCRYKMIATIKPDHE